MIRRRPLKLTSLLSQWQSLALQEILVNVLSTPVFPYPNLPASRYEPFSVHMHNLYHCFTEFDINRLDDPQAPKLTKVDFKFENNSDQGKAEAHRK